MTDIWRSWEKEQNEDSKVVKSKILRILPLVVTIFAAAGGEESQRLPDAGFPEKVTAIDGQTLDVKQLAAKKTLVVVTLKATWCEVCQEQLLRIKKRLSESQTCGLSYLVLAPGPRKDLLEIQEKIGFPYPFIEDQNLRIAKSLGLQMSEEEIFPAILVLRKDLKVGWMQTGRSEGYFGDPELLKEVRCAEWI